MLRDLPGRVVRRLPDEQPEQQDHDDHRSCLADALHQTMNTVVPTRTLVNSHSESTTCIRMQPCEAFQPIEPGSSVPWIPTPGAERPIQRVPSGLFGPGGTGLRPGGPRVLGRRVPGRVDPLDDDRELAGRRRVDRLPGRDREDAPDRVVAVEERQPVGRPVDQDHGPDARRRDLGRHASSRGRRSAAARSR